MYQFENGLWYAFQDLAGIEVAILYYKHKKPPFAFIDIEFEDFKEIQTIIRKELKARLDKKLELNSWISQGWLEIELTYQELEILLAENVRHG